MDGWTISVEAELAEPGLDHIDALLDSLHARGGAVSLSRDGLRLGATYTIDPQPLQDAIADGLAVFGRVAKKAKIRIHEIVDVHVRTWTEHDRELVEPLLPDLVGVGEIAELLEVSRQRASELQTRRGFPSPALHLKAGPVWVKAAIERFAETWQRRPGRPSNEALEAERASAHEVRR